MKKEQLLASVMSEHRIGRDIIQAFKSINRENFVPEELKSQAYYDIPLPLKEGATISQPTTVLLMLQYLEINKGNKILEIGSGSGYNAALISKLVGQKGKIVSVEIDEGLVDFAKNNLKKENIRNVKVVLGDGSKGYIKESPFDRIIVTAAVQEVPEALMKQLKLNGILLAPVGSTLSQELIKFRKLKKEIEVEYLGTFSFVPLR
ncbi:MAG TPA: protein-L-isoaspartate(D-aspartate) O-methyltransferase [Candidatus Nanoarchaeia archaeon]|nr:protein-L-isoaspartate(D-aspartate) O-methyltransferase [Candidatus Nanoarchaeia archaeon]